VKLTIITVPFVLLVGFLIAGVCGYMAGLIGASNSPISGIGILAVLAAALLLALSGFSLWLARAMSSTPGAPAPHTQLAWAKHLWRIVLFEEPDFYLWIALAIATARYDLFVPFIAAAYAARALGVVLHRAVGWFSVSKESHA
jgi:hypothetical protein